MDRSRPVESFRGLLLRHRGRTSMLQRELAERAGVSRRSIQDWESGLSYPTAERLQAIIGTFLDAGVLTAGREAAEARELWAAAEREAPRMRTPFDEAWFASLLAGHAAATLSPTASRRPLPLGEAASAASGEGGAVMRVQDWGESPDTLGFVGRGDELALLRHWVVDERCRLVAVLGMGGIGKTSLAAKLAQDVAPSFARVYWRSLRDAPPVSEWLTAAIGFLSDQQVVPPATESERVMSLLQLLRDRRCLLVLDNSETLFEPGQREGRYRAGMAGYGRLLQAMGEASHPSCLVLTSREAPPELAVLGGGAVRTFELGGLGIDEAQVLLAPKQLEGTSQQWGELNARVGGNGLALKVVGETIREVFGGEIGSFLEEAGASSVFGGIRRLLSEQVERSSALEQQVLRVLAVEREPVHLPALLALGRDRGAVLEAVEALRRRSLLERAETPGAAAFTLQSVVLEYVTDRLVEEVGDEIARGEPELLVEQALIQAQAKDYVRQTQERLIGSPILLRLNARHGGEGAAKQLLALLEGWRARPLAEQGYGPGNVVNLLRLQRGHLRGLDLSRLAIRQAYLAQVVAQDASLADAHLAETVLAEAFHFPASVALSGDGALLAVGTSTGQVCLWRVADRIPLWAVEGHTGVVSGVALSEGADGHLVASAGEDGMVRLWEAGTGRPLAMLPGHTGAVWGVALSADGKLVAGGGADGTVRLWETSTGRPLATLHGHTGTVFGVALSADDQLLVSGGTDGTVRLWETAFAEGDRGDVDTEPPLREGQRTLDVGGSPAAPPSGWRPQATLQGHTGAVGGLALSADGHLLASGSGDGTVRLWETRTGRPLATLHGHIGGIWRVVLSTDGQLVASGGEDGTVRLWETRTERPLASLQGHTGAIYGVALSADSHLLASVAEDGTVRLWETRTERPVATLYGLTGGVWSVALSANGQLLASGGADGTVRLWESSTGRPVATLHGHTGGVWDVALSADGQLVASGGADGTVRLWETGAERETAILHGHSGGVWAVALSEGADGQLLASSGTDGTVRLWETSHKRLLATLQGHTGTVRGVALSANGRLLISSGEDGAVRLWEAAFAGHDGAGPSGEPPLREAQQTQLVEHSPAAPPSEWRPVASLPGHTGLVLGVALSADGRLVASGSPDGTVRLWQASTARPVATLQGHTGGVWGVALSADSQLLVSGGSDGTVRLWETSSRQPVATMQGHTGGIRGVALSVDGQFVASGSLDGTVRLWEARTGKLLRTLRPELRYERMDITGVTGITAAQRQALIALGAVDRSIGASRPPELAGPRSESKQSP